MAAKEPMAGWIGFASILMLIIGFIDFFQGLIAVIRKHYFVVTPDQVIVFNVTTWGWLMIIWGIVLVLVGLALGSGAGWARWVTIVVGSINLLGQLSFLGSSQYTLWTLTGIALSIIVLFALTARWEGYPQTVR